MKKGYIILIIFFILISFSFIYEKSISYSNYDVDIQQVLFDPNNISTFIYNTGIFNQDLRTSNTPGFQWPKGTLKHAIFTSGFNIAAYVNDTLRMATASFKGEYLPGYIADSSGFPVARTDLRFKLYSVKRGDNAINNPDWLNWGLMVPFGAPYVDADNNGIYNPVIDTPGVRNAEQTVFGCLTDGFPESHKIGEGFGGGTMPLYAEVHFTAWGYNNPELQDVQFLKWEVINKSYSSWHRTNFAVFSDNDLGGADDDYNGCDTIRQLGYTYNGDNDDDLGPYSYGINPPAVGMILLESAVNKSVIPNKILGMSSFIYIYNTSYGGPLCERDANGEPLGAYNFMRGVKKDSTPWVIPNTSPPRTTKHCYTGDPETLTGWTEFSGSVWNCGGSLTGNNVPFNTSGNRTFVIGSGAENLTISPNEKQTIVIAQLIARGTSNVNSATKLKQLSDYVRNFYFSTIGIKELNSSVPVDFILYQNYPNPFNPVTTIKFDISQGVKSEKSKVKITIFDATGKLIAELLDENLTPGTYKVKWDASDFASGVYYYKLVSGDYSQTRKMVLLK